MFLGHIIYRPVDYKDNSLVLRPWLGPIAWEGAQRLDLGSLARCARLQVARCPQRLNHQRHSHCVAAFENTRTLEASRFTLPLDTASSKMRPDSPLKKQALWIRCVASVVY
jgi:hypothetical protein